MKDKFRNGFFAGIGMLVLILDSKTAIRTGTEAIELCLRSVVPSIFPFLVLSGILTGTLNRSRLPVLSPIGRLLGVPQAGVGVFLTGILGGYPVGAQAVQRAWQDGTLSKTQAQRMLAFCSNAGPAFLFGILSAQFEYSWIPWMLWLIHISSAVLVSLTIPGDRTALQGSTKTSAMTWIQSLERSIATMGYICGWIILFRVILGFLQRWILWLLPQEAQVAVYGFLELANGCLQLSGIESLELRFVLCSGMLSFGGLCVMMQTASVISGLGMKSYVIGKLLQTIFSLCLSCFVQEIFLPTHEIRLPLALLFLLPVVIMVVWSLFRRKRENNSSIPAKIGV